MNKTKTLVNSDTIFILAIIESNTCQQKQTLSDMNKMVDIQKHKPNEKTQRVVFQFFFFNIFNQEIKMSFGIDKWFLDFFKTRFYNEFNL